MSPPQLPQHTAYLRVRDLARKLRKNQTAAEIFFWLQVRNRQLLGLKINRQQIIRCPLDPGFTKFYIADFYCHELMLIIELDGDIHKLKQEADLVRTELMDSYGYQVVRFTNEEVLNNWSGVVCRIEELLALKNSH